MGEYIVDIKAKLDKNSINDIKKQVSRVAQEQNMTVNVDASKAIEGLVSIKNEAGRVVKYIGSVLNGYDSFGFVFDVDTKSVEKLVQQKGSLFDVLKIFSIIQDRLEQYSSEGSAKGLYNVSHGAMQMVKTLKETFGEDIGGILEDTFLGKWKDRIPEILKGANPFEDIDAEQMVPNFGKQVEEQAEEQSDYIESAYDKIVDSLRGYRDTLRNQIRSLFTVDNYNKSDFKYSSASLLNNISNIDAEIKNSKFYNELSDDQKSSVSAYAKPLVEGLKKQLKDAEQKLNGFVAQFNQAAVKAQRSVVGKASSIINSAVKNNIDPQAAVEQYEKFIQGKKEELQTLGKSFGFDDVGGLDGFKSFDASVSKGLTRINNALASKQQTVTDAAQANVAAEQQNSAAADQAQQNADKIVDAAEREKRALESLNDVTQRTTSKAVPTYGIRWDSESITVPEAEAFQDLIDQKVEDGFAVSKIKISRTFDDEGSIDGLSAKVVLFNERLGETVARTYRVKESIDDAGVSFSDLSVVEANVTRSFTESGTKIVNLAEIQANALQKVETTMTRVPNALKSDSKLSTMFDELKESANNITSKDALQGFNVQLSTFKEYIRQLSATTKADKFDPLAGLDQKMKELPAKFAAVENKYNTLINKDAILRSGTEKLNQLYEKTSAAVKKAQTDFDSKDTTPEVKIKSLADAVNLTSQLRQEIKAVSTSEDEALAKLEKIAKANINNYDVSGLSDQAQKIKDDISQSKVSGGVSTDDKKRINDELAAYKTAYQAKLAAQKKYENNVSASIKRIATLTAKQSGYDNQSIVYSKIGVQIENERDKIQGLVNKAKREGLTTDKQVLDIQNRINDAIQNQSVTVNSNTYTGQYDRIEQTVVALKKKLSNNSSFKDAENYTNGLNDALSKLKSSYKDLQIAPTVANASVFTKNYDSLKLLIQSLNEIIPLQEKYNKIANNFDKNYLMNEANKKATDAAEKQAYISQITSFSDRLTQFQNTNVFDPKNPEAYKKGLIGILEEYDALVVAGRKVQNSSKNIFQKTQETNNYKNILQETERYYNQWRANLQKDPLLDQQFKDLMTKLQEPFANFDKSGTARSAMLDLKKQARDSGYEVTTLSQKLSNLFSQHSATAIAMAGLHILQTGLRQIYTNVVEIDTALVELRKVTDASDSAMEGFLENAKDRAVELGVKLTDLINASSGFARMGYGIDKSAILGESAVILNNVGDEVNGVDNATGMLISTMKGFGLEADSVNSIIDKLNETSNKFSITAGGLGVALQKSSAAAYAAGNTLDQTVAMITVANSVAQDADSVGTALKTLTMRIRGAKTELEDASLDTEGMAISVSTLRDKVLALTNVDGAGGFDILTESGAFKSTYDILYGIGRVWKSIADVDQASLLQLTAGQRQGNIVAAILNNYQDLESVLQTSINSDGSAMKEYANWMDSIQAKTNQFKAAFQSFSETLLDDDIVKGIVDVGTALMTGLDNSIEKLGTVKTLIIAISSALAFKQVGLFDVKRNEDGAIHGLQIDSLFNSNNKVFDNQRLALEKDTQLIQGWINANIDKADLLEKIANDTTYASTTKDFNLIQDTETLKAWNEEQKKSIDINQKQSASLKASALGWGVLSTAMNMALNALIATAVSFAIQGIVNSFNDMITTAEEAADAAEKVKESISSINESVKSASLFVSTYSDRFAELSKFVGSSGNNLSLTTEEYKKYQSIVNQIAEHFPSMIAYYNEQGDAVLKNADNVTLLNKELDKLKQKQREVSQEGFESLLDNYQAQVNGATKFTRSTAKYAQEAAMRGITVDWVSKEADVSTYIDGGLDTNKIKQIETLKDLKSFVAKYNGTINDEIKNLPTYTIDHLATAFDVAGIEIDWSTITNVSQLQQYTNQIDHYIEQIQYTIDGLKGDNLAYAMSKWYEDIDYAQGTDAFKAFVTGLYDQAPYEEFNNAMAGGQESFDAYLNGLVSTGEAISTEIESIYSLTDEYKKGTLAAPQYISQFMGTYLTALEKTPEQYKPTVEKVFSGLIEGITSQMQDQVINIVKSLQEATGKTDILENLPFYYADNPELQAIIEFLDLFGIKIDGIRDKLNGITEEKPIIDFDAFNESIDAMQDKLDSLSSAYEKWLNGDLTDSDVVDLLQEFPEIADGIDIATMSADGLGAALQKVANSHIENTITELKNQLKEATDEETITRLQTVIALLERIQGFGLNVDYRSMGRELASNISDTMEKGITGAFNPKSGAYDPSAYLDLVDTFPEISKYIDQINSGTMSWMNALNIIGKERLQTIVAGLKEQQKTLTGTEAIKGQASIDYFEGLLKKSAVNLGDYTSAIATQFMSDMTTLSDAYSKLQSGELTSEDVISLIDQFPALASYVDASSESFGKLNAGLTSLSNSRAKETIALLNKELAKTSGEGAETIKYLIDLLTQFEETTWTTNVDLDTFQEFDSAISVMRNALEEQREAGKISSSTMNAMNEAGLASLYTIDNLTGSVTVSEASFKNWTASMIEARIAQLELEKSNLAAELYKISEAAIKATASLGKMGVVSRMAAISAAIDAKNAGIVDIQSNIDALNALLGEVNSGAAFKSSGGGNKYKPEVDALWEYKQALEETQRAIGALEDQMNNLAENDYSGRTAMLEKLIELKKVEQEQMHDLAEAGRAEIRKNITQLAKYGFEIEYVANSNTLLFKNLDKLLKYSGDTGEKLNDLIEYTKELNSSNIELSSSWYDAAQAIKDYKDEIIDLIAVEADAAQSQIDLQTKISEVMIKLYEEGSDQYKAELTKQEGYLKDSLAIRMKQLQKYAEMGLAEDDDRVISALSDYWSIQGQIIDMQIDAWEKSVDAEREAHEARQEALEDQQDALQDIIDLTVDLIKKEKQDQIDAISEQIDGYKKIVEEKQKALEITKDALGYEKELANKTKTVSDLQNRIQKLSLDDSREAQAERIKLTEDLTQAQDELNQFQTDKSYEMREKALDDELDAYTDTRQKEIDVLQEYLNQSGTLIQEAMERISSSGESLYQELISYNATYGDGVGTDLVSAWEKATAAIQAYGSIQAALNTTIPDFVEPSMPDFSGSVTDPNYSSMLSQTQQATEASIIAQMKANSAAWHTASEEEKKRLHEENKRLAAQLGLDYNKDYNTSTGKWYRNGYPLYHKGLAAGYVGSPSLSLKEREELAILKDKEVVLNGDDIPSVVGRLKQIPLLYNALKQGGIGANNSKVEVNIDAPFTFTGSDNTELRDALAAYQKNFVNKVQGVFEDLFTRRGYSSNAALSALKFT